MYSVKTIAWLAGYLEGEGSFFYSNCIRDKEPRLSFSTTDRDIAEKAAAILGVKCYGPYDYSAKYQDSRKPVYVVHVKNKRAIEWMMTLCPLLGERRKRDVLATIKKWKETNESRRTAISTAM